MADIDDTAPPVKRGRGRPPKNPEDRKTPKKAYAEGEARRGRGRPPGSGKKVVPNTNGQTNGVLHEEPAKVAVSDSPKKRGRPPKAARNGSVVKANGESKGKAKSAVNNGSPRKRGRPPKAVVVEERDEEDQSSEAESEESNVGSSPELVNESALVDEEACEKDNEAEDADSSSEHGDSDDSLPLKPGNEESDEDVPTGDGAGDAPKGDE